MHCADAGTLTEVKTEADNISEHPQDDNPRPCLCTVSNERFTERQSVNMHSKTQAGENWYSCSQCEKRFYCQKSLRIHMNVHKGKYRCTECDIWCPSSNALAVHRCSHSGEKPFECTLCSKRFTRL